MIEVGQYVKIVFRNSTQAEGTVEFWSDKESILVSTDKLSKFIIFNTQDDVMAVKICYEAPVVEVKKRFEETVEEFKRVYAEPSTDELRNHNLAHLKTLMNEQEKKIISDKVKSHTITNSRPTQYGLPSISSIARTK